MSAPGVHQVGGHPLTIRASPYGSSTLIKPSNPTEHAFYTSVGPSLHPDWMGTCTPAFYGTLKLQGQLSADGVVEPVDRAGEEMLVLENLTYRFLRPNVLDIKLGTQLHSDDASAEKRERMEATAGATTSGATGVRLTGFQVWDELSQSFIITDKTYGKSLRPHQLPEGVARFFLGTHLPSPLPHRLPILSALATRLRALETLVESLEVRIRGGSLLIVVEGDPAALISALERESVQREKEGVERDEEEEGSEASMETSDEEGVALPQTCVPWELRLIDFAHATRAEGQGADQGLLRGIRTVRELVEGLLEEVRKREEGV